MQFFYYWQEKKQNIAFKARSRDLAIKRIEKITKKPWYEIDRFLKSDLQMATLQGFRINQ